MKKVLLLFMLVSKFYFAQDYTISGYISENKSGESLIGATIFDLNSKKGTVANEYGFFSITLPKDSVLLKISFVGYKTDVKKIFLDGNKTFNIELMDSDLLEEVVILGEDSEGIQEKSSMSTINLSMSKVKALPVLLGEVDVVKTLQLLPGVQSGSEGGSGMYVRGGGPDQNLILLDGVPIYNASHLFGFFSVFNADAINSVKLIKGGFPAQYGGRLSSVIDIRMKEGNMKEFHGEGSIGILSSKLMLEGPLIKDKTSFAISGRRTYIDVLAYPFIKAAGDGEVAGYFFQDLNAKINHKFSNKSKLYLSSYFGKDKFYSKYEDESVYENKTNLYKDKARLEWGNRIAALRWNYQLSPKLFSNITATYSRYKFLIASESESESLDLVTGEKNFDEYSLEYKSGIRDFSIKSDFDYAVHPDHYVKFGGNYTYHTFTPGINQETESSNNNSSSTETGSDIVNGDEFYLYAQDDFKLNNRIKLNGGLHFSGFKVNGKLYTSLQPRFSGRLLLSEKASLKASYSSMAQYLHLLSNAGIGLPTDLWLPPTENIAPQYSEQFALGYARTIKNKFEFSVEGYYKTMKNLLEYKDGASFILSDANWENLVEVGKGWSYGAEILLEKKKGKTTGWIGYTLSWTERQFDNLNFGEVFPYKYDRRHDISVAVTHKFSEKVDIGVVWVYGTGNAVSLAKEKYQTLGNQSGSYYGYGSNSVDNIESRNNYRLPSYHRLDVGVNFHKKKKRYERTWSFGVYNIYSRQNPFYIYFSNNLGKTELTQVSIFPIIPSVSYKFKF